jgi:sugar phosphate isomerase/epimerase
MFKPGLCSVTFRDLSRKRIVELCVRAGIQGIEWGGDVHVPDGDPAAAGDARRLCDGAGLDCASFGSYYRIGHSEAEGLAFSRVLETARILGSSVIRVWAGGKEDHEADAAYFRMVVEESRRIADLAAAEQIAIAYEFHCGTLTNSNEAALRLMQATDHPNLFIYWQPPYDGDDFEYAMEGIRMLKPWIRNVHLYYWKLLNPETKETDRRPLAEAEDKIAAYLREAARKDIGQTALIEFVRGGRPEQLIEDAVVLRRAIKEAGLLER